MIDPKHGWNVSFKPLVLGLVFSLILLVTAWRVETHYQVQTATLEMLLISFAVILAVLQLVFFMHIGLESKPRWNTMFFFLMLFITFILVGGSIWIMHNLGHNLMYSDGYSSY